MNLTHSKIQFTKASNLNGKRRWTFELTQTGMFHKVITYGYTDPIRDGDVMVDPNMTAYIDKQLTYSLFAKPWSGEDTTATLINEVTSSRPAVIVSDIIVMFKVDEIVTGTAEPVIWGQSMPVNNEVLTPVLEGMGRAMEKYCINNGVSATKSMVLGSTVDKSWEVGMGGVTLQQFKDECCFATLLSSVRERFAIEVEYTLFQGVTYKVKVDDFEWEVFHQYTGGVVKGGSV